MTANKLSPWGEDRLTEFSKQLRRRGVSGKHADTVINEKDGVTLDTIAQLMRREGTESETATAPNEPAASMLQGSQSEDGRAVISSWEEFLHSWQTCRTQLEALALVRACGDAPEVRLEIPSFSLPIIKGYDESYKEYWSRKQQELAARFRFLINVAQRDADRKVRSFASDTLYQRFLLQQEEDASLSYFMGYFWDFPGTPDLMPDALRYLEYVLKERNAFAAADAAAQFLCIAADLLHRQKSWDNPLPMALAVKNSLSDILMLSHALEKAAASLPAINHQVGDRWGRRNRDIVTALVYEKYLDWRVELTSENYTAARLPVEIKTLAAALRRFFLEAHQKQLMAA